MNDYSQNSVFNDPTYEPMEEPVEVKICENCWNEVAISEAIIFTEHFNKGTMETILCPDCAEYEIVQNGFNKNQFKPML